MAGRRKGQIQIFGQIGVQVLTQAQLGHGSLSASLGIHLMECFQCAAVQPIQHLLRRRGFGSTVGKAGATQEVVGDDQHIFAHATPRPDVCFLAQVVSGGLGNGKGSQEPFQATIRRVQVTQQGVDIE